MAFQQGRSERRGNAYSLPYVESLSDARTPLVDFFNILLDRRLRTKLLSDFNRMAGQVLRYCHSTTVGRLNFLEANGS